MRELSLATDRLYPPIRGPEPPIKKLALGILAQAFWDALFPPRSTEQTRWRKDAMDWFFSDDESPGSLKWVCEILHMDSDRLRQWVRLHSQGGPTRNKSKATVLRRFLLPGLRQKV